MDLTYDELERYLEQICTGIKVVDVNGKTILFKQPTALTRIKARQIYESEYNQALEEGLISNEEMQRIIKERNLINKEDKRKLSSLESQLEAQKILLGKTTKVRARQDRIKEVIRRLEDEIRIIKNKERSKFSMTAETKAEESKILYLCWCCCYDYNDELYWNTYESFLNESDFVFRQKTISEFILFYSGIPTSYIRKIARSNLWRIKYITSLKTSETLFGVPTSEYSNDMMNLAYWSHFYQNVYDMMPEDQPSEFIIDDDEALDAYLKDYYEEKGRESMARKSSKKHGKLSAFDKEEVLVTKTNELYEDIKFDKPKESSAIKDKPIIQKKARRRR